MEEQAFDILLSLIDWYEFRDNQDDWGNTVMPNLHNKKVLKATSFGDEFTDISVADCIKTLAKHL